MEISYRSIITKFMPDPPEGEEYYKKTLKKINEMLNCLELKDNFDEFLKSKKLQTSDANKKFTKLVIQIIKEYNTPEFGIIIRSYKRLDLLKEDALFANCKSIDHILEFYSKFAELLKINDIKSFLNFFYISRLCLFYKQLYRFEQIFSSITTTFGPNSDNTVCLTHFFSVQNEKYCSSIEEIINNYEEINNEQIYADAEQEIANYTKEENDAMNLYYNYLIQVFDDPQFKILDDKLEKVQTGIYNTTKDALYSKIIKEQSQLSKNLTENRFYDYLAQFSKSEEKEYWNHIYHDYIENHKIDNLGLKKEKSTKAMLREAISLSIRTQKT